MATVTGPTPLTFVPQSAAVVVNSFTIDMHAWTYSVNYGDPANRVTKTATGPVPLAIQTAMLAQAQKAIEAAEGWAQGSATTAA